MRGRKAGRIGRKVPQQETGRVTGAFRLGDVAEVKLEGRAWPENYQSQLSSLNRGGLFVHSSTHIASMGQVTTSAGVVS